MTQLRFHLFALFLLAVLVGGGLLACGGDDGETVDGDNPDGDNPDGDDPDGDDPDGDDPDGDDPDGDAPEFVYESCAALKNVIQFPTPAWEQPGESLTGVVLAPPEDDRSAELMLDARENWYAELSGLDGFPLVASFFVALEGEAQDCDSAGAALYAWLDGTVSVLDAGALSCAVEDEGRTLILDYARPLPMPQEGERYILALNADVVNGATPVPACDGDRAHADYVTAAQALVDAGHGEGLVLALPFTPSRTSGVHAALYSYLAAHPALTVTSAEEVSDFSVYGEEAPDAATLAVMADTVIQGLFTLPRYQNEAGEILVDLETGRPIVQGDTVPGFILALPKNGTPPLPWVLLQHGGGRYKRDLFMVAKPYLEAGMAVMGMDLLYHGDRDAGGMAAMADFSSPKRSRDNFRQTSADHLAVLTGVAALNDSLDAITGATQTLDNWRTFYIGHSMGSISGTLTTAVADTLSASCLIAGGAPYRMLLSDGLFKYMMLDIVEGRPAIESRVLMAQLQSILDGGDPGNYPTKQESRSVAPKHVLLFETIGDPVAINPSTDLQAWFFGAGLSDVTLDHAVTGMPTVTPPVENNMQFDPEGPAATRVHQQYNFPEVETNDKHMHIFLTDQVHTPTAACFAGVLDGSGCVYDVE